MALIGRTELNLPLSPSSRRIIFQNLACVPGWLMLQTNAMTIPELRSQCEQVPFQPFVVHLADGRHVPVHHPDFVMFAPNGRAVIVYQPDSRYNVVDLQLVTDLEISPNGEAQ